MKRHFVYMLSVLVFPLLLVICCTSLFVSALYTSGDPDQTNTAKFVTLFNTPEKIEGIYNTGGTLNSNGDSSRTSTDFYSPFLVATNNKIVALAGVNSTESSGNKKINILANYTSTEKAIKWFTEASGDSSSNIDWTTQFAVQQDNKKLKFIFAAACKETIYILLVNDSAQNGSDDSDTALKWQYSFFVGAVVSGEQTAKIKWENNTKLTKEKSAALKRQFAAQKLNEIPSNGFVLLTEEGNIFFALQFDKTPDDKKTSFAFIQFKEAEPTVSIADLDEKENGCTFKLFAWKENIMLAEYCENNKNRMHELQLNNGKLIQTNEPISRLLHYLENKNNFTAAKIDDNVSVLLFTQQQQKTDQGTEDILD